ncbi:MAG: SDR family NAD(P)-dependent oxidoreductase, partial [Actinomycetota bacterium]
MEDFAGRSGTAVVTGGSGGIGAAIVRMLAERGSDVLFTYRANRDAADAIIAELSSLDVRVMAMPADLV